MKVLIIGNGGREHALAWKCAQDQNVKTVYVAPGNAGTANELKVQNLEIDASDFEAIKKFCSNLTTCGCAHLGHKILILHL